MKKLKIQERGQNQKENRARLRGNPRYGRAKPMPDSYRMLLNVHLGSYPSMKVISIHFPVWMSNISTR